MMPFSILPRTPAAGERDQENGQNAGARLHSRSGPSHPAQGVQDGPLLWALLPRKIGQIREVLTAIGQAVKKKVYRLGWRWRIKRDFRRDPLRCPRYGQPDRELSSLTIRYGNRLITLGGMQWLGARGSLDQGVERRVKVGDVLLLYF